MSKSNISDAKYIYIRQAAGTRADGGEGGIDLDPKELFGAWKVDANGNETKVEIYDLNGKKLDSEVCQLQKVGDSFLFMSVQVGIDVPVSQGVYIDILVDKTTNKIYECPKGLLSSLVVDEYPKGTLHYTCSWSDIFKATFTPNEIVAEELTLPNDFVRNILVSKGGVVYFSEKNFPYDGGGQILMPSKRRYPVKDDYVFISGNRDLFSIKSTIPNPQLPDVKDYELFLWKNVSDTDMEVVKVGSFPGDPDSYLPMNTLNGKAMVFCRKNYDEYETIFQSDDTAYICEVDHQSIITKKTYTTPEKIEIFEKYVKAIGDRITHGNGAKRALGDCNYCLNGNFIMNFDAQTYKITETEFIIPEDEYKVRSMEIDPTTGKVVFKALRYMDSANVLGEVDKNGVVSIISVMHPTYDISVYCALN